MSDRISLTFSAVTLVGWFTAILYVIARFG